MRRTYRPGTHINLNEDKTPKALAKIAPVVLWMLALYGFGELALKANGF